MVAIHDDTWHHDPAGAALEPLATRWAFKGRVSTEDQQDPTLSLPRQYRVSEGSLPPGGRIVACFYDIDSGRKDVAMRGAKLAHERFDIPLRRDGGIQDLLAEARRPDRRFDYVICESISRISRDTHVGTGIERELERAGVTLFAADEPIVMQRRWGRAAALLNRRLKQIVSEYEVRNMLELSWNGLVDHTLQGWNIGKPPYGYLAEEHPHPVPARRAEGATKTRLILDAVRAPVVAVVFAWRVTERLSYQAIADRLNADPDAYPPPVPAATVLHRRCWYAKSVEAMLANPKYTGYMVWNRSTASGGREHNNPPTEWVWSTESTHDAIVPRELYDAAQTVARTRRGSRSAAGLNAHPLTRHSYPLRSFVYCGHDECGRRMVGHTQKTTIYYVCTRRPRYDRPLPGHPMAVYVNANVLHRFVGEFFAQRIFGPQRQQLLAAAFGEVDLRADRARVSRLSALERAAADASHRVDRLLRNIEVTDDPRVVKRLEQRISELEDARDAKLREIADERKCDPMAGSDRALLDDLPTVGGWDVLAAPAPVLRRLLETFRLRATYSRDRRHVDVAVTLDDATIGDLRDLVTDASSDSPALRLLAPSRG